MKRVEMLGVIISSFVLTLVGVFMLVGPWALVGGGLVALVATFFVDVEG